MASSSKVVDSKRPNSKDPDPDDMDQDSDPLEGREDSMKWIKKQITKQVAMFGGKFGTNRTFPWKLMPNALADDNVCIKGYPAHKCLLPGESCRITSSAKSKGVAGLTQKEVTILVEALKAKSMNEWPVIFGEAPPLDYPHAHARCLFVDEHINYNGPPCIKSSTATTKIKKSTTSVGKSGMHLEVVPPPSRPFKVVARPPPHKVIDVQSTSPDSQDANDQHQEDSESEYEDASHGKRKKRKSSGELHASKKRTSPVDILPKAGRTGVQSKETPVLSQSPTKGGPLSPLTVESSGDDQDLLATTTMHLHDGPSEQPANTKARVKAHPVVKGSHWKPKPMSRYGCTLRTIYSDADSDTIDDRIEPKSQKLEPKSQKLSPRSADNSATSSADVPADTTEVAATPLSQPNIEVNGALLQSPPTSDTVQCDVASDIGQVLGQTDTSFPTELPQAVPHGGAEGAGGMGGAVVAGGGDVGGGAVVAGGGDVGGVQFGGGGAPLEPHNLPMNTDCQSEESMRCQEHLHHEIRDPRMPSRGTHDASYPMQDYQR
ncbi:hypothetical protein DFJ58DRAFT_731631 [Suillus subalutaceus]|uniref:uncharacterized protein n=1 Tax=Suillus subalutaceus TaxID=48586 RepID=UPI001B867359|nr:uncharacterized protein DFJ58DRAFT_731631 [Suillus subalutaceus]KAG1843342.1 hypothetical protein DFJ58DRAFT_731631 [Suillus subalutaceus]